MPVGRIDLPNESDLEVWEVTTDSTVWVWVYDRRNDRYNKQRVGGKGMGGSRKLTISVGDRRYNQEMVVDEMRAHDPFTNGMLRRLSGPELEDDEYLDLANHFTNERLVEFFALTDEDLFREAVDELTSETVVRRLHSLAVKNGMAWQLGYISDLIDQRYRVGGTQPSVAEMIAAGDMQGGLALS